MLTTAGTVAADVRRVREQARHALMTDRSSRTVDIAFVAEPTPRREKLIASATAMLWEWCTDIQFGPAVDNLSDTRIVLNVHGDRELAFDWARACGAIADGCVVVSETSRGFEPLVPGVHFVMAPYEHLVEEAVALAFDEPRRVAIAHAAQQLKLPRVAEPVAAVESARRAPRRRRSAGPSSASGTLQQLLTELKVAIVAQCATTRSLEATISLIEHGDPDHLDSTTTSAWSSFDPEVSVVVPLFNEARHVRETIQSVIAASGRSGPAAELVIIDDHSTDDSRDVSQRLLAEMDWFPATLVARAAHGGPASARNAGVSVARAAHVLALDAGSTLFPTGLTRLLDRLRSSPSDVVATYGLIEQFDTTGTLGLAGHLPWDINLLVNGEFPDTIAMMRRDALLELGGFTTPAGGIDDGWSDYDLWLTAAEGGMRAEVVGSVIGRSRRPLASMLEIRNADIASTYITLRERHPRLPWPS